MLLLNTTAPELVRAPGVAPGTADWQTATLLLRHARIGKLGPCRTWAAGWLQVDPIGRSVPRPRIESRRFLKEKEFASRIPELTELGTRNTNGKMAASTGFAPVLPGLKGRCPQLLDDEAT